MNLKRTSEDVADRVNRQVAKQTTSLTRQVGLLTEKASGLAERLDRMQTDLARRVVPQPKPRQRGAVLALLLGAAAGYAIAWFFDPDRGRARRAEVAQRLDGVNREATRAAQRGAMVAGDRAAAIRSKVVGPDNPDPDDLTLLDRVKSEVFADPTIPKEKINLMVVDGKAVIRGQVEEPQIGVIETAVRKVVGVKEVENLLHPVGTPAPNKAAARAAGNGDSAPI
jgi:hypothetical protein